MPSGLICQAAYRLAAFFKLATATKVQKLNKLGDAMLTAIPTANLKQRLKARYKERVAKVSHPSPNHEAPHDARYYSNCKPARIAFTKNGSRFMAMIIVMGMIMAMLICSHHSRHVVTKSETNSGSFATIWGSPEQQT